MRNTSTSGKCARTFLNSAPENGRHGRKHSTIDAEWLSRKVGLALCDGSHHNTNRSGSRGWLYLKDNGARFAGFG